jgi:uncharacterized protein YjbI with pentapeptide repeats
MAARLWRGISRGLARLRWPLAGLAAMVVILACVLVIPQWLVRWELGASARTLTAADRAKAINDIRATLLQGIGGAVLLLGAYFTYRQLQTGREQLDIARQQSQSTVEQARDQLQIAQQGQVTERFTRAIDQLGHAKLDVRLGGIYALERIANDSPGDRATIAEVLTAFVRGHAPWPPRLEDQPSADTPIEQIPEMQVRAPDVQAALTVLARRQPSPEPSGRPDLHATDLRTANLVDANLRGINLNDAQLQGARLDGAQLQGANLVDASLQDASLVGAQLQGAHLEGAHLQRASLYRAELQSARLDGAQLQRASLIDAQLQDASLVGADLRGAHLERAQFQGAHLDAELQDAQANSETIWPVGFDPRLDGVVLDESLDDPALGGYI